MERQLPCSTESSRRPRLLAIFPSFPTLPGFWDRITVQCPEPFLRLYQTTAPRFQVSLLMPPLGSRLSFGSLIHPEPRGLAQVRLFTQTGRPRPITLWRTRISSRQSATIQPSSFNRCRPAFVRQSWSFVELSRTPRSLVEMVSLTRSHHVCPRARWPVISFRNCRRSHSRFTDLNNFTLVTTTSVTVACGCLVTRRRFKIRSSTPTGGGRLFRWLLRVGPARIRSRPPLLHDTACCP